MNVHRGTIYLVGAGPGDPDLMTVRGMRLIQQADTIVHDRLIPAEVLKWARPEAKLIDVGKYPDHHRIKQPEINDLLVKHGLAGEMVVRLKGGDPFVFGRAQEEMDACRSNSIPCVVVPGVSSCIAGPAAVGIPVTTRGLARSFAVLTGHTDPNLAPHSFDYDALAKIDTLVLMMAYKHLGKIASSLIDAGLSPDTPAASIQRATQADQIAVAGTLATIADRVRQRRMGSPMITVIGDVASMIDPAALQFPDDVKALIG
jgi:uroporphyrin-III C-methyltransferase